MSDLSKERLEEILAGTEGVTPGPWYQSGPPWFRDGSLVLAFSPDGNIAPTVADCEPSFAERDEWNESNPDRQLSLADVDAAHIKNCDPDTIRSMASELLRLRESRPPMLIMEAAAGQVLDAVREYLEPGGIDKDALISRVIHAVDNPSFNMALRARSARNGGSDG